MRKVEAKRQNQANEHLQLFPETMKPYKMWVIATPEGWHVKFLMHFYRKHCIEAFNKWSPVAWPEYRKLGWRCVPVMVHPMETPTKSTKRTK